jgi:hypothetical protein
METKMDNELIVSAQNPLDIPAADFAAALERRGANRKALMAWVREALKSGTDFGTIQIGGRSSKESLWKPGAEKICGMLGLRAIFPTLPDYERAAIDGKEINHIILRCHLLDSQGNVVADGVGARSVEKERGDLNKALKMAEKSALIDATLRCAGLSEIFTQDIEDMNLGGDPEQLWGSKIERQEASARVLLAFREGATAKVDEYVKELSADQAADIWRDYDAPTRAQIKKDLHSYREALKNG